ncbi:MAG: DUF1501 domain-containing protein [Burkholderiales bacterium]|nr:DUF1501 domain-containing protein [Burkholderiales bacterium]
MFNRRDFLTTLGGVGVLSLPAVSALSSASAFAQTQSATGKSGYQRLLILVELRGANDGLNTFIPYTDDAYYALRPTIGVKRDQVLKVDDRFGLHPALEALAPMWQKGEMAAVNGLGYPKPNLSHFRSIEIWDTGSNSSDYLSEGWLARAFTALAPPKSFVADGIAVGGGGLGPFAGGARALSIASTDAFLRQAKLADPHGRASNAALQHILRLEGEAQSAALNLNPKAVLKTKFPTHGFGQQSKTAMQIVAASPGVAALRIGLGSFDTHQGQQGTQQALLKQLAEGIAAIKQACLELGRWQDTTIVTYCEFGRRAKENQSAGTDHGTANTQFVIGGAIKGGIKGAAPSLTQLSGDGNLIYTTDYRALYASVLRDWWKLSAAQTEGVLGGYYAPLPLFERPQGG